MPTPTLDATPGGASANSYCTVAEADAYHDSRLAYGLTTWSGANSDTKTVALIMATRWLDSMYIWTFYPSTSTQALQWPRNGIVARNQLKYVLNTEIPQELKNATAELARQLIIADRTLDSDIETQGITSLRAGPVSLEFKDSVTAKTIPDAVVNLLPPWWGYVRGTGNTLEVLRS